MKKQMSYEESAERLQEIIELLEDPNATLEDSLKLFEEGTKLIQYCGRVLTDARQKVDTLSETLSTLENQMEESL